MLVRTLTMKGTRVPMDVFPEDFAGRVPPDQMPPWCTVAPETGLVVLSVHKKGNCCCTQEEEEKNHAEGDGGATPLAGAPTTLHHPREVVTRQCASPRPPDQPFFLLA